MSGLKELRRLDCWRNPTPVKENPNVYIPESGLPDIDDDAFEEFKDPKAPEIQVFDEFIGLREMFLNLFWLTAPFLSKNVWRHPYICKLLLWGTLKVNYW